MPLRNLSAGVLSLERARRTSGAHRAAAETTWRATGLPCSQCFG
jgi:hypothetical protein